MADETELLNLTFSEIKKLKVAELKVRLSSVGLPVSGLKADLVARLASYVESRVLQAALYKTEEESNAHDEVTTDTVVLQQPEVTTDTVVLEQPEVTKVILVDSDSDEGPDVPSEQGFLSDTSEQVLAVVSQVTKVIADAEQGDTPISVGESLAVAEPSVEVVSEVMESNVVVDSHKEDVMQIDQPTECSKSSLMEDKKDTRPQEKVTAVEQKDKDIEIQEEKGVEIQDVDSCPEEVGVEIQPDKDGDSSPEEVGVEIGPEESRVEPQSDIDSTEPSTQEVYQTDKPVHEDQVLVQQSEVGTPVEIKSDIGAGGSEAVHVDQGKEDDEPQPIDVDQSEEDVEDVLSKVVELAEIVSDMVSDAVGQEILKPESPVEDMETETTEVSTQDTPQPSNLFQPFLLVQEPTDSVEKSVEDKQQSESTDVPSEEELLQPSSEVTEEKPSLQLHPDSHPPLQIPSHPQSLLHKPPQVPSHPPFEAPPQEHSQSSPLQPNSHLQSHLQPMATSHPPPQVPSTQTLQVPTHVQPHPLTPSIPPAHVSEETEPTTLVKTKSSPTRSSPTAHDTAPKRTPPRGTPPKDTPLQQDSPSPRRTIPQPPSPKDSPPQQGPPSPRVTIPKPPSPKDTPPRQGPPSPRMTIPKPPSPKDTTPQQGLPSPRGTIPQSPKDSLSEAKRKARSLVEMRERRLNQESQAGTRGDDSGYDVDHYEQEGIPATESRQEKRKKKKKKRKKRVVEQPEIQDETAPDDEGIEVEYVPETLDIRDPVYAQFAQIFETFKLTDKEEMTKKDEVKDKPEDKIAEAAKKDDDEMDTDSDDEDAQKKEEQAGDKVEKISKKKLKLKNRMSVAELKQTVHRPDVVEMHDVTAPDPKLLVYLKACRNTVPVPRHWCFKRKFLQGKRGIIKPPFQLPEFIQKTGIMEMREALQEKEDAKNMKAKMREKIRPKMGKIDIDYQKLHDAFFKWQTKPKMSIHGDLYYEGKEFETKLKEKKPGDLSEDLRTALGMPTGQGSNLVPPPWLIAMQRYGPPPSYPNLKIPGLNAPIPEGASFGYHAGGWGKPPVDEHGRPLYGDVFGLQQTDVNIGDDEQIDSNLWGELESESEESEESEEESEEEAPDQSGLVTPAETGLVTPSGLTSIPAGMETPDMIELRKRKNIEDAMESGSEQPTLYTVLPEKRAGVGGMMMGTSHVYDLATAAPTGTRKTPGGLTEGVEVALDPSELELDPAAMQARYDEQLREQQSTQKEDFSDMVAEHAARQQKKRKKTTDSGKAAKKYKEFKF